MVSGVCKSLIGKHSKEAPQRAKKEKESPERASRGLKVLRVHSLCRLWWQEKRDVKWKKMKEKRERAR